HLHWFTLRLQAGVALDLLLGAGLVLLAARGWAHWRRRAPRGLSQGDWAQLLALLVAVSVLLALGPVVHVARRAVGEGPYVGFYPALPPLHVLRITVRFGILTVAGLALLAALGWTLLAARLRGWPVVRFGLAAAVIGAILLEYAVWPAVLIPVAPRPVDAVLQADPDDVAVLEWPISVADTATEAMFRSVYHGKRVVNGYSGFTPPSLRELSGDFGALGSPFPTEAAQEEVRRIYALRYVVVRLGSSDFEERWRPTWLALRQSPPRPVRFRGTYGTDDLYEVTPLPERRRHVERVMSRDMLARHPWLRVTVTPVIEDPAIEQAVEVRLNAQLLRRIPLSGRITAEIPVSS